jgi:hypothetical protein
MTIARGLIGALVLAGCVAPDEPTDGDVDGEAVAKVHRPTVLAEREHLIHGIAGDEQFVFVTEPGVGGPARVAVLDRATGAELALLPAPPGGFRLPFTARVPATGHLIVLDNAGFPPVGAPTILDYRYSGDAADGTFTATLERVVDFTGLPLLFAEDFEVLDSGDYVVSESVIGGLWLVAPDGAITPALFPSTPAPLPELAACQGPAEPLVVGGVTFRIIGTFAPGVGSLAVRDGQLYFGMSCRGGVHRIPVATLYDATRSPEVRAGDVQAVSPRPADVAFEIIKGLAFNRWDPSDPYLYAGDTTQLRLIRVDVDTGAREVLSSDARLFNFTVAGAFLPPRHGHEPSPLVVASDQEHRWSGINEALPPGEDQFQPPFVVTSYFPKRR